MSFAQEKLEDSLRRLRVRQDLADARLDGVEAAAEAAAAPPAGSAGAMPESALFQGLGRYAHWKPPAFAVWWVSGGGGRVGVSVPEGCVSWDGESFPASAFSPAPQEDREMRVRWCEVPPPEAPRTVLFAAVVAPFDRTAGEAGDPDEVRLVWAESEAELRGRLDTESRHVAAAVPVAEYDPAGDRLVQVHVGALALGGGYTPWPEPFPYGAATVPEYTDAGQTETRDVEYEHYVKADGFVFNGAGTTVSGSGIPVDESTTQVAIVSVGTPPEGWTPGPDGADPDELTWEHRLEKSSSGDVQPPPAPDHGAVVVTPLYDFDGYEVVKDYRGQFLPVTTGVVRSTLDDRGPFAPVYSAAGGVTGFSDGYVQVGGFTVECEGPFSNPASPGQLFVAARVSVSASGDSGYSVALSAYSDFEALRGAQQNLDEVVYPLYRLAWAGNVCSIDMDLRRMPTTGMLETSLTDSSASGGSGS